MSTTASSEVLVREMLEGYDLQLIRLCNNYKVLLTNKTFSQI